MSRHIISSSDSDYQPYKPVKSYPYEAMHEQRGPFFSCNSEITEPHFHLTTKHPKIDNSDNQFIIHQLHVPGYDEHDGNDVSSGTPPYHIITGWHISGAPGTKMEGQHFFSIRSSQKSSPSTDNQESFMKWNIGLSHVFDQGGRASKVKSKYDNLGDPSISKYEYEPFGHKNSTDNIEATYFPRAETNGLVKPAHNFLNIMGDVSDEDHAKNILLNYTQRIKNAGQHGMESKVKEDPGYWNDLFNRESKRIYTIDDAYKIVSESKYHPWTIKNASCNCNKCSKWYIDD